MNYRMAPIGECRRLPDLSRHLRRACATADQMVRDHLVGVETRIRNLTRLREALRELSARSGRTARRCWLWIVAR
ncbi:MerR family DNA-binding protein [Paraburkholderia hospita]|uniref:MerR family DNA-binding protein n=1 Tax=Paraburkholderia hospita TaxID=169430 RepID=UPI0009A7512E